MVSSIHISDNNIYSVAKQIYPAVKKISSKKGLANHFSKYLIVNVVVTKWLNYNN